MKPLIKITTVPIKMEMQTTRASLKKPVAAESQPDYTMRRRRGGMQIRTTQPQVQLDMTQARASTGLRNATMLSRDFAQQGMQTAREYSSEQNRIGRSLIESAGRGNPVAQEAMREAAEPLSSGASYGFARPDVSVTPGSISFDYQMDSLTFDWNVNTKPQLEFVPANIEYNVAQYPRVIIEYVGEPIYVPASSNPNYR